MDKIDGMSMDIEATNLEKVRTMFPECVSEGKLDIDKLLSLCGEYIDNDFEKYKFEWKGKSECLRLAQRRSNATLRPCEIESVNFDTTQNLYIEGDNLEVLKLLQTAYFRKVKMIYIDPPYNTGNDFVYEDDFADPMAKYKEITAQTTKSNPETMGRFHTNWLNMMYPRLRLAANLLRDDGVIFISIDDNEVFNLKKVCDEVFGEENFVSCFPRVTKKAGKTTDDVAKNHDYILMYTKYNQASYHLQSHNDEGFKNKDEFFEERGYYKLNQTLDYDSLQYSPSLDYPIEVEGKTFYPGTSYEKHLERKSGKFARADWAWRWSKDLFDFGYKNGFVVIKNYENYSRIYTKTYQNVKISKKGSDFIVETFERTKALSSLEFTENSYSNDNSKKNLATIFESSVFDYSKPISLIKSFCQFTTDSNDIILDFFSGSATTAHAVMQLNAEDGGNRKFIMVQLPEPCDEKSEAFKAGYKNICEIGKERIRRAGKKVQEENRMTAPNLDIGFKTYKLDTSNLQEWDSTPIPNHDLLTFSNSLNSMTDSVKSDRCEMDVVTEIMLKMGVPLDIPVTTVTVNNKTAYAVGDFLLLICLAQNITAEDIEKLCDYAPGKLILAESSFADTSVMRNAYHILKDRKISVKLV